MFPCNISLFVRGKSFDLTGWTAKMEVREEKGAAGPALITLTTTANAYGSVLTITGETLIVVIEQPQMETLPENEDPSKDWVGAYDIVLIDPSGRPQSLIGGAFVVNPGVTR